MRNDARLLRPEPRGDQIFVLASWEVNQAVDAAPRAGHSASVGVLPEKVGGIARLLGLLRGEVAGLADRDLE